MCVCVFWCVCKHCWSRLERSNWGRSPETTLGFPRRLWTTERRSSVSEFLARLTPTHGPSGTCPVPLWRMTLGSSGPFGAMPSTSPPCDVFVGVFSDKFESLFLFAILAAFSLKYMWSNCLVVYSEFSSSSISAWWFQLT